MPSTFFGRFVISFGADHFKKVTAYPTHKAGEWSTQYGLVLTDIRMPTMNGFELYQKIKEIDKNIKVHFLAAGER